MIIIYFLVDFLTFASYVHLLLQFCHSFLAQKHSLSKLQLFKPNYVRLQGPNSAIKCYNDLRLSSLYLKRFSQFSLSPLFHLFCEEIATKTLFFSLFIGREFTAPCCSMGKNSSFIIYQREGRRGLAKETQVELLQQEALMVNINCKCGENTHTKEQRGSPIEIHFGICQKLSVFFSLLSKKNLTIVSFSHLHQR